MARIVVISGPANSGKMPLAMELIRRDPSLILVSRDRLREAMVTRFDEGVMTQVMADLVEALVMRGGNVIVCAWNMEASDRALWAEVATAMNADIEWHDTRDPDTHLLIPPKEGWTPIGWEDAA